MKKAAIFSIGIVLCLALASCGGNSYKGAATISGSGIVAYQTFNDVYGIIEDNIDAFSPKDVIRLRSAGEILQSIKVDVYVLMTKRGSALKMVEDLPSLIPLYEEAKAAYLLASGVVMSEIDEFGRADQLTLYAFQDTCSIFDTAIEDALNDMHFRDVEKEKLVKDIVGFVILVGKIALPLIIV